MGRRKWSGRSGPTFLSKIFYLITTCQSRDLSLAYPDTAKLAGRLPQNCIRNDLRKSKMSKIPKISWVACPPDSPSEHASCGTSLQSIACTSLYSASIKVYRQAGNRPMLTYFQCPCSGCLGTFSLSVFFCADLPPISCQSDNHVCVRILPYSWYFTRESNLSVFCGRRSTAKN